MEKVMVEVIKALERRVAVVKVKVEEVKVRAKKAMEEVAMV